ncbi:hypothetical protein HK102_012926 [Quaeritorhiza haematococci]|nr:hypothetical protein HK102_012926 [Quaeritorhiza haematococci]
MLCRPYLRVPGWDKETLAPQQKSKTSQEETENVTQNVEAPEDSEVIPTEGTDRNDAAADATSEQDGVSIATLIETLIKRQNDDWEKLKEEIGLL